MFTRIAAHIASISNPNIAHLVNVIAVAAPPVVVNPICNDPLVKALEGGLTTIISLLMGLGVSVAVIGIIVGGLMRATSWGSEQRIATSNKAITSAVTGLIICLLAVLVGMSIPNWFGQPGASCPVQNTTTFVAPTSSKV